LAVIDGIAECTPNLPEKTQPFLHAIGENGARALVEAHRNGLEIILSPVRLAGV